MNAIELANWLSNWDGDLEDMQPFDEIEHELRRLHAENESMRKQVSFYSFLKSKKSWPKLVYDAMVLHKCNQDIVIEKAMEDEK